MQFIPDECYATFHDWLLIAWDAYTVYALLVIALLLYFFPSCVAFGEHHKQRTAIFVLNLFAGWTFVGCVAALVWAFTEWRHTPNAMSM